MTELLSLYRTMLRIRRFEEAVLAGFKAGKLRGTAHVCIGQEAVAAGACAALAPADTVVSNHRGHGHLIARGGGLKRIMAELYGMRTGYALGRGGSQHMAALEIGFLGSNGITGGGLPVAVGSGLAHQLGETGGVCLAFFGDGASAQGTFHESLNLAALWRLPVIFLCENNQYAMSTPLKGHTSTATIAERAIGYGIPRHLVNGNDPQAVETVVRQARENALAEKTPVFVEAVTYRLTGHSRSDPCAYRTKEEEACWFEQEPIRISGDILRVEEGAEVMDALEKGVAEEIDLAVQAAEADTPLPAHEVERFLFPQANAATIPPASEEAAAGEVTYAEALTQALARALRDPRVLLLGEDIAEFGGAFRVTKDLAERFGAERVRNCPISENTLVGAGVGAAVCGWRPVVEIMFMDFLLLALDQLGNHAAKYGWIYGGQGSVPLTVRTPAGGRRGYGATHSQCFESILMSLPGLKVYAPATVQDAYVLALAAVFDDAPAVLVEHKLLYGTKGLLDPAAMVLPPGKARIARAGKDLTIVTYSHMLLLALRAAEVLADHGIEAEVIDLRTLNPLDMETVRESCCRTQRALIAEEGYISGGVGAELAARIQEDCFGYLDAPVLRVAARDCPVPTAESLERVVLPQAGDIVKAARKLLG